MLNKDELKKFNSLFTEDFKKELVGENKKIEYKEVEPGAYEVKLEKIELSTSKAGAPMVKGMFRIIAGKNEKQCLFINQVVDAGWKIKQLIEWINTLGFDVTDVELDSYDDLQNLLLDTHEFIEKNSYEYQVQYNPSKFGVNAYVVENIFFE